MLHHTRVTAEGRSPDSWLLMLHGIYGSGRNWGSVARRVAARRPEWGALLVDLRLHGDSRDFEGPHTLAAAARDLEQLVSAVDFHAAAVLGHSFGGKVALVYLRNHAGELKQAWVIDSTLEVKEPQGSAWRVLEAVRSLPSDFGSRDEFVSAFVQHGYEKPVGQWLAMNLERADDGRLRWRLDWSGVEEMLRDYFQTDVWGVIEQPPGAAEVHIVRATRSNAIDPHDVSRIVEAGQRSGRTVLHEIHTGHWVNTEDPESLVELLVSNLP